MKTSIPTNRRPTTPGEMLVEEYLKPLGMDGLSFALAAGLRSMVVAEIINNERRITPNIAIKFGKALNTTAEFWVNLQYITDLYDIKHGTSTFHNYGE